MTKGSAENYAAFLGVGAAAGSLTVPNERFDALGSSSEWIRSRTGIVSRKWVGPEESVLTLAEEACRIAVADAGVSMSSIDGLIVATVSQRQLAPGLAPELAHLLGLPNGVMAFDVSGACAGFLVAMATATAYVESGASRRLLVVGAETVSRLIDSHDRSTAPLFGDAAGAVLVEACNSPRAVTPVFKLYSDGSSGDALYLSRDDGRIHMDGPRVYESAVESMAQSIREVCCRAGVELEDLKLIIPHQANARITRALARELDVPVGQVWDCIDHIGNVSSASIPYALAKAGASSRLKAGDLIGIASIGAGLTWGAGVLVWK